jgi:HEAT repeat protein
VGRSLLPLALLLLAASASAADADLKKALEALESGSAVSRAGACRRLGEIGGREVVPPLLKALRDDVAEVREAAVDGLMRAGQEIAVPQLALVLDDTSPAVRGRALLALGKLGGKYAVPKVAAHLADPDPGVRVCAIKALGELGDPVQAEAIRKTLDGTKEDPDHILLATAIVALAQLEGAAALDDLFARSGEARAFDSWLVRASLVWAVGEAGDRERLPFVRRGFASGDARLAGAAAAALLKLGETEEVVALVEDDDAERRHLAVAALAETGGHALAEAPARRRPRPGAPRAHRGRRGPQQDGGAGGVPVPPRGAREPVRHGLGRLRERARARVRRGARPERRRLGGLVSRAPGPARVGR